MNDFSPVTGIDWNAGGKSGMARFGDDSRLLVAFYNKAVENTVKSQEAGRRICENQIYVRIQQPGEMLNVVDRPVTDQDKVRFRDSWSKFLHNRQQIPEGTPIDLLFPNNPAFAENLRAYGIHTIEQCAKLSANGIDNIGRGGQECVNKAQLYLENANKGVNFHAMQKTIDEYAGKFRQQEMIIGKLQAQLDNFMMREKNPDKASLNPKYVEGFDAQSERINANHVTKELAQKKKSKKVEIDAVPEEPIFEDPFVDK